MFEQQCILFEGLTGMITEYNRTVFTEQQNKFSGASTDTLQGADLQLVSPEDCRPLVRDGLNLDLPRSTFCTSSRNGESTRWGSNYGAEAFVNIRENV